MKPCAQRLAIPTVRSFLRHVPESDALETVERVLSGSLSPRTSRSEPRAPVERYGSAPRVSLSNVRCSARARCPGTNAADALDGVAHDVARTLRRQELSVRGDVDLRQAFEQIPCVVARLNGGPAPNMRLRRGTLGSGRAEECGAGWRGPGSDRQGYVNFGA